MIRLPKECSALVGRKAEIFEPDHEGQVALLVVPGKTELARIANQKFLNPI
jgi:hypothetical protein